MRRKNGRRVKPAYRKKRTAGQTCSRTRTCDTESKHGRQKNIQAERRSSRQLRQLVVSALILVSVIGVKLLSPQTLEPVRSELLRWMGTDTDVVSVFSAVGRTLGSREDWGQAISDACVAVFGTQIGEQDSVSKEPPEDACMTQQVLSFPYAAPLQGSITDRFGYRMHPTEQVQQFHYGLDIEAESGTVIHSFADGTVTAVGESSALGKYVTVSHANGYATLYAHCSRVTASAGQQVQMSDPIAEVGETGLTTGPHLHFELHRNTQYLNPIYYVGS